MLTAACDLKKKKKDKKRKNGIYKKCTVLCRDKMLDQSQTSGKKYGLVEKKI